MATLEPGTAVYFTDRHALDVVDAEVFQHLGSDPYFGERYSVFSTRHNLFYDVWEGDLTRLPRTNSPAYERALLICECIIIALLILAVWWLA